MLALTSDIVHFDPVPNFSQVLLQTERLSLRPLHASDASAILSIRSNPIVMRYHSSPPWTSIDQAYALIAVATEALQTGDHLRLAIERKQDHALIGTCGLFHLDQQCRRAEIGYELHLDAWGKGYMHEAQWALLEYAFSDLALNRIEADIHPANIASAKSVERLGFRKEGHLRERWIVGGEVSDSIIYGLLASDWRSIRQSQAI